MTPRVYFDACCLNRPFDDPSQLRIRLEAEAVMSLLRAAELGGLVWVSSNALSFEVSRCPDEVRREAVAAILEAAHEHVDASASMIARARDLASKGFGLMDATHMAVAEGSSVDVLLTTDDPFRKRAGRLRPKSSVRVVNPVSYAEEVLR